MFSGSRADNGESEWIVFETQDEAEKYAIERVEEDLENEPELFNQDFLQQHLFITETDRRIIANEEADSYTETLDDDRAIEEADMEDEKDELEEAVAEMEKDEDEDNSAKIENKLKELQKKLDNLGADAKEKIQGQMSERIYKDLEDPIQYFIKDTRMYSSIEELMKTNFISIDIHAAAIEAVGIDGVAHFLDSYDGSDEDIEDPETGKTYIAYGTN
jgi:hypothetical protein